MYRIWQKNNKITEKPLSHKFILLFAENKNLFRIPIVKREQILQTRTI